MKSGVYWWTMMGMWGDGCICLLGSELCVELGAQRVKSPVKDEITSFEMMIPPNPLE